MAALRISADPKVIGVWGTSCSSAAVTAAKIISKAGMVMISSSNTASELTSIGGMEGKYGQPGYFRTSWNDSFTGAATACFAFEQLGLRRAAVVHAGDAYTQGLADVFAAKFTLLGGEIVLDSGIDEADTNIRPITEAVSMSGAELVFLPLRKPETVAGIVKRIRSLPDLKGLDIILADVMVSDVFLEAVGEAGVGLYLAGPEIGNSPEIDRLVMLYRERYGEAPRFVYHGFTRDAVELMLKAVASVAEADERGILHIGRQALREALQQTRNFPGATGSLSCNAFGDCGHPRIGFMRLDDPAAGVEALHDNVVYTAEPQNLFTAR